jgi:hypothetical protein
MAGIAGRKTPLLSQMALPPVVAVPVGSRQDNVRRSVRGRAADKRPILPIWIVEIGRMRQLEQGH